MKIFFNIPLLLSLSTLISAQNDSCYANTDFTLFIEKQCSFQQVRRAMAQYIDADPNCQNKPGKELGLLFGATSSLDLEAKIVAMCARATANADLETIAFSEIAGEEDAFDIEYFNGGTYLNLEVQTTIDGAPDNVLKEDAAFIKDTMDGVASNGIIQFPTQYENFDSCDLRATMCCWIGDRQANDNNGNCKEPYETNCVDSNPKPNTRVCLNRDVDNAIVQEYPRVHCHGFAWADDPMDMSSYFKGNNLFYVSMYDHLYTRGYVKNIPEQAMCGCIEDMPAVQRSDCTEARAFAKFALGYTASTSEVTISFDSVEVNYKPCMGADGVKNDLEAYYTRLVEEGRATAEELVSVQDTLDKDCDVLTPPGASTGGLEGRRLRGVM
jgi:hypothetical protein